MHVGSPALRDSGICREGPTPRYWKAATVRATMEVPALIAARIARAWRRFS